jgi:hypothetical protein
MIAELKCLAVSHTVSIWFQQWDLAFTYVQISSGSSKSHLSSGCQLLL